MNVLSNFLGYADQFESGPMYNRNIQFVSQLLAIWVIQQVNILVAIMYSYVVLILVVLEHSLSSYVAIT